MTSPKLLLADDSVTIRKVVELTFADEGVEVFSVADGDAAMLKFIEIQPDIVLVDVEMPGPNGYQICEMIKQDDATKHIPVLLLVGSFEPFDQDEAERVQADGFLTKPFSSIRELVARVNELTLPPVQPEVATPETEDIVDLYNSSFAETSPIDEYDTEEDIFHGVALGEGFIAPSEPLEEQEVEIEEPSEAEDPARDDELIEATSPIGDDELIEEVRPMTGSREDGTAECGFHAAETIEATKDFDWSPSAMVVDETPSEPATNGFEPRYEFEGLDHEDETAVAIENESSFVRVTDEVTEPSAELIELLAKRIVEKLSDKAIRDIAQEAVPRIAEKLIREALADEGKT